MSTVPIDSLTLDEALEALGESTRVEVHEGNIVVNPPRTARHQDTVHRIINWLQDRRPRPQWWVFTGVGIRFGYEDRFIADVVVMRPLGPDEPDDDWKDPALFELVVEVLSPSSRRDDRGLKLERYVGAGLAYWIVDPDARSIEQLNDATGLDVDELVDHLWRGEE